MHAVIIALQQPKSEHTPVTCEDFFSYNAAHGLFAVADGVGTASFSNVWARLLTQQFIERPLLSEDPFEFEAWLRISQEEYKKSVPNDSDLPWFAQAKAHEGGYSTLVTLRVIEAGDNAIKVVLLSTIRGDSCALISREGQGEIDTFPLKERADFDRNPICIPSKLKMFDRRFHRLCSESLELHSGDRIILATDAVARWVFQDGQSHSSRLGAFNEIANQNPTTWEDFIKEARTRNEIVDDDSTALIIDLNDKVGELLGECSAQIRFKDAGVRRSRLEKARNVGAQEMVAIWYGSGEVIQSTGLSIPEGEVEAAQTIAANLTELRRAMTLALENRMSIADLAAVWTKHNENIQKDESDSTNNLINSLKELGVDVDSSFPLIAARIEINEVGNAASVLTETQTTETHGDPAPRASDDPSSDSGFSVSSTTSGQTS